MPEISRLSRFTYWISLDFVERQRTPERAMKLGIQLQLAGLSLSNTVSILEKVNQKIGERVREFVEKRGKEAEWHHRIQEGRLDDVVDAAVLALTAEESNGRFSVFPQGEPANGSRVIVYPSE